jgi:rod shape-determining protein MreD
MDPSLWFSPSRLIRVALLLALGLAAIFVEAAPLGLAADAYPSPDILFCVVAYWSIRRPEAAVLIAVFALGLARDLMTDAPVGAGVLSLVFASEFLKALGHGLSRRSFATEWLLLATVLALVIAAQWLIVLILLVHPPYLTDLAHQWLATMVLYPVLALVFRWLFRIGWRKGEPAQGPA